MTPHVIDQIRQAINEQHGGPVQLVDEMTRKVYYIISKEQFETIQALYDDREFSPHELYPLISKTAEAAGWDEPLMDDYDNYDEHRHESQSR